MARTLGGNYTGRAAATERNERMTERIVASWQEEKRTRRLARRRWWRWLNELKRLDPGWEAWYDARPEQTTQEMLPLIQERVRDFRKERPCVS